MFLPPCIHYVSELQPRMVNGGADVTGWEDPFHAEFLLEEGGDEMAWSASHELEEVLGFELLVASDVEES